MGTHQAKSVRSVPREQLCALDEAGLRRLVHHDIRRKEDGAIILDELGLCRGQVRADVMAVNGVLHGFEIKSERDSLKRLPMQVAMYSGVVDRASLVAAERHVARATQIVPDWWEIKVPVATRSGETRLKVKRRGRKNPAVNPRELVELLWYDQALALLRAHGAERGVAGKSREALWNRICERVPLRDIQAAVRNALKTHPAARRSVRRQS